MSNKETALSAARSLRDPFALMREMASEFDRVFDRRAGSAFRWPSLRTPALPDVAAWSPKIDVFERDNRLVTKADLPGLKKEDVTVEVAEGHLAISGQRKSETEKTKDNVYRCERSYGSFYRAVPLPEGVTLEDVKATFADGVLEVSVPLPARSSAKVRKVDIQEASKSAKTAA